MKPLPIRMKFALWASALTGVVLAVYSVGTFINLYHEQLEAADLEIDGEARHLLALHPAGLMDASAAEIVRYQPWLAVAHFDENGQMTIRSPELPESLARAALTQKGLHTAHVADSAWRIGAWSRGKEVFIVAYNLEEVHDIVIDLILSYALSLPVVILIAGAGGWWVSGRALAPVRELSKAAERVQASKLDQRVTVPAAADEIQRLALVLNEMFGRLENSFAQAQRFAADASHELRTPLTIIRGEVEQLLHANGLTPVQEAKLLSVQEEIRHLERITEHLLLLARFDAGKAELKLEWIDLSALVKEVGEDAELLAAINEVRVAMEVAEGVKVMGDHVQLRRLLLNLLQNAVTYNHSGGEVACAVLNDEAAVKIRISNTGSGISPDLHQRVFERFFRGDRSRTERQGHGLGLSLCKEIVLAHGGEIILASSRPGWTEFLVTLPRSPSRAATQLVAS